MNESLTSRPAGRGFLQFGIALSILPILICVIQYYLRQLIVPWYLPVLTTIGASLVGLSWRRRPSAMRLISLVLVGALAGLEWFVLVSSVKLPDYAGSARAGEPFPAFETTLANGDRFSDQDLRDGQLRVLTFFRGRW